MTTSMGEGQEASGQAPVLTCQWRDCQGEAVIVVQHLVPGKSATTVTVAERGERHCATHAKVALSIPYVVGAAASGGAVLVAHIGQSGEVTPTDPTELVEHWDELVDELVDGCARCGGPVDGVSLCPSCQAAEDRPVRRGDVMAAPLDDIRITVPRPAPPWRINIHADADGCSRSCLHGASIPEALRWLMLQGIDGLDAVEILGVAIGRAVIVEEMDE